MQWKNAGGTTSAGTLWVGVGPDDNAVCTRDGFGKGELINTIALGVIIWLDVWGGYALCVELCVDVSRDIIQSLIAQISV